MADSGICLWAVPACHGRTYAVLQVTASALDAVLLPASDATGAPNSAKVSPGPADAVPVLAAEPVPTPPPVQLRPYQEDCIKTCLEQLQQGVRRQAVSLPVGSGKTVVFSNLITRIPQPFPGATRTLVLAHREELLHQACRQIVRHAPQLRVEMERGIHRASARADVIVASVATLGRVGNEARLARFDPRSFKCVIIDEAHHAAAVGYNRVLAHFGLAVPVAKEKCVAADKEAADSHVDPSDSPPEATAEPTKVGDSHIFLWGCSATLNRHDGLSLRGVFDRITYHRDFLEMIAEKWLCGLKAVVVETRTDISKVGSQGGDFSTGQLAAKVNTAERNDMVIRVWKSLVLDPALLPPCTPPPSTSPQLGDTPVRDGVVSPDSAELTDLDPTPSAKQTNSPDCPSVAPPPVSAYRRRATLVFAVDIEHVRALWAAFRAHGIPCEMVTGRTPNDERSDILARFYRGEYPVLINCAILTEGTDIPHIDCILMARPTQSSGLYQQMVGRGLRRSPGKTDCLVLDFVDITRRRANVLTLPDLTGLKFDYVDGRKAVTGKLGDDETAGDIANALYANPDLAEARALAARDTQDLPEFRVRNQRNPFRLLTNQDDPGDLADISQFPWVRVTDDLYVYSSGRDIYHMVERRLPDTIENAAGNRLRRARGSKAAQSPPPPLTAVDSTRTGDTDARAKEEAWVAYYRREFEPTNGPFRRKYLFPPSFITSGSTTFANAIHLSDVWLRKNSSCAPKSTTKHPRAPWQPNRYNLWSSLAWRKQAASPAQVALLASKGVTWEHDAGLGSLEVEDSAGTQPRRGNKRRAAKEPTTKCTITKGMASDVLIRLKFGGGKAWKDGVGKAEIKADRAQAKMRKAKETSQAQAAKARAFFDQGTMLHL
ncbi:DEAD DEAH box helicase [Tieghemiomyces parasiticus]|uniref:DEAD DEAH box helicase n=1 Tax=Tieghemiomyces parasiticus TaxID=78921 RepID=A0A9W8ALX9_9FUNG|nr:DEAD DEAH box helicase [Tieghemiomyces parasiticus]